MKYANEGVFTIRIFFLIHNVSPSGLQIGRPGLTACARLVTLVLFLEALKSLLGGSRPIEERLLSKHSLGTMPCFPRQSIHKDHPSSYPAKTRSVSPTQTVNSSGRDGIKVQTTVVEYGDIDIKPGK